MRKTLATIVVALATGLAAGCGGPIYSLDGSGASRFDAAPPVLASFGGVEERGVIFAENGAVVVADVAAVRDAYDLRPQYLLMEVAGPREARVSPALPRDADDRTPALADAALTGYPPHRIWSEVHRRAKLYNPDYGAGRRAYIVGVEPLAVAYEADDPLAEPPDNRVPSDSNSESFSYAYRQPALVGEAEQDRPVNALLIFPPNLATDPPSEAAAYAGRDVRFVTFRRPVTLRSVVGALGSGDESALRSALSRAGGRSRLIALTHRNDPSTFNSIDARRRLIPSE